MSNSAINQGVLQAKINNVQNAADSSAVYSAGVWSFKNSTALTSVTITDAGNVGIGTASPVQSLHINTPQANLRLESTSGTNNALVRCINTGGTAYIGLDNSTGGLGSAYGLHLFHSGAYPIVFSTNNLERARIDASGNLLVGTTSAANALAKFQVVSSGANNGMLATTDVAAQSPYLSWNRATSGNNIFLYCTTEATGSFGTERGSIYYDRAANQTKIAATSDERLKTNIKDAPSLLEKVCAIKVREYAWKETGSENIGFIAQELNAVVPRAVWEGEDNEDGTIKRPWSVDNPTLVPYLVKAIQELSAKVEEQSLRLEAQAAEIAALKAS